jgi:hypothetical protein
MTSTGRAPTIVPRAQREAQTPQPERRALPAGLLAFAAYLAFALFVTWPWASEPRGLLFGVAGGDLTNNVAVFQQLAEERQPPFLPGDIEQVNAPEGLPTDWALHLAGIGSSATVWLLSLASGAVAAHGIVAVVGFALSALAMFLLARWVTQHAGVAFVVGLAYGFWPFMYGTGWTWPHYIHLWGFVLLTWRMLVVAETPTLRNGLLAGGAAVVAMTWIQYHLLIGGVAFATLAARRPIGGRRAGCADGGRRAVRGRGRRLLRRTSAFGVRGSREQRSGGDVHRAGPATSDLRRRDRSLAVAPVCGSAW